MRSTSRTSSAAAKVTPTVLFAERATKWVPVKVVRIVAALIYVILGVITLLGYSRVSL
jgi:putative Ca2+/H+ antiporter (TMEM165/GDT1 family)